MSRLWTNLNNPSFTNDYTSPISDVLSGELQELPSNSRETWRASDFAGWLPVPVAGNVTAFGDVDLIDTTPPVPDERSFGHLQTCALPEKSNRFFTPLVDRTVTSPYIIVHAGGELYRHTRFSPDFFNIKRFMAYVVGQTPTSPILQEQPSTGIGTTPVVIHPQVVREAEEKSLTDDLETSIKLAQEIYSTLKRIDVNLEHDPEIVDRKTIRFVFTVSGKPGAILENEALFKRCLRSNIDARTRELITVTYNCEE